MMRRKLLEKTFLELYYRGREHELDRIYPRVLALLTYHMIGMNQGIEALKILKDENVRLSVWADREIYLPHELKNVVQTLQIDDRTRTMEWLENIKESFDYLFIPVLSFSLVSQLIWFNDDHPFVRLILWSLLSGKRVAALSAGADPYNKTWGEQGFNRGSPLLKQELRKQLERLRGFGVSVIESSQIPDWLATGVHRKKKVITSEDIQSLLLNKQQRLVVTRDTIVTPLAADLAEESRIQIDRE